MGNKMLNWILIILIFIATTMIIWIIYSINDLSKYQECLQTNQCEEIK